MRRSTLFTRAVLLALCAAVLPAFVSSAFAAAPTVAIAVTGDATPGATVTAKATVTTTDGSVLQSISWKQVGGLTATVANTTTDTITITLPDRKAFRHHVIEILEEAPIPEDKFPVKHEYYGGLQDRFVVAGVSPHALTDAGGLKFEITMVTTSGTYKSTQTVAARLPWVMATGVRNVPVQVPVILHGKTQPTYNWVLGKPTGSGAALLDPTSQDPEFTPDVPGKYTASVTDAAGKTVVLEVIAGKWKGIVIGEDANGRPKVDAACTTCHVGKLELFSVWAKSGHAEIFKDNVNNDAPDAHYRESCLGCHTVGYEGVGAKNNGINDQTDFATLQSSGMLTHGDKLNWTKILTQFPASARMANIQCENCHGPQDSDAHGGRAVRINVSSEVCGTCHGEPTRHSRYQQWQISGHANYETAVGEGTNPSCAKCHSAQGFLQWDANGYSTAAIKVDWTADEVHPQTCVVCHDPHAVGTTSGNAATNAPMRLMGTTPMLDAGFKATGTGKAAICMTCHNGRRGLRNDTVTFNVADAGRAPHVGPQADIVMGENLYFVPTGTRSYHSKIEDSCVTCHMNSTKPPAALSNNFNGTNHTFYADKSICQSCHTAAITVEGVQAVVETKLHNLEVEISNALKNSMQTQIKLGNAIDLGGQKTVRSAADIVSVEFIESHGQQGVTVNLAGNAKVADLALSSVKVVRPGGGSVNLLSVTDTAVAKAGWNYFMVHSDKSEGVHNPGFVNAALDVATFAVKQVNAQLTGAIPTTGGSPSTAYLGGGPGNGAGAVACTTPYVYWTEIAGHMPGNANSQWRTDVIARNLSATGAKVNFVLHQASGTDLTGNGTVVASGQSAFEDIVATLGGTNNVGTLEICSDQPLLVMGRIFNQATEGTFGQNLDGRVADIGYGVGQTVNLIGLRQKTGAYRSNIIVTNAGKTEGQVSVTLYDAKGTSLKTYTLTIPAGTVLQDSEPFNMRATSPDVDWGYATVTVLKGANIHATGSMIDQRTNDPTTIPAKQ